MKSFGTAKASLLIQKKKQNNQQPPNPWSLVRGSCGVPTCRELEAEIERSGSHAADLLQAVLKEAFSP